MVPATMVRRAVGHVLVNLASLVLIAVVHALVALLTCATLTAAVMTVLLVVAHARASQDFLALVAMESVLAAPGIPVI
jgi:hypothetical protein